LESRKRASRPLLNPRARKTKHVALLRESWGKDRLQMKNEEEAAKHRRLAKRTGGHPSRRKEKGLVGPDIWGEAPDKQINFQRKVQAVEGQATTQSVEAWKKKLTIQSCRPRRRGSGTHVGVEADANRPRCVPMYNKKAKRNGRDKKETLVEKPKQ